ncbi:MAG TPA: MOSC N-terminal beta barrel domain-containing protein [Candidatus Polarisedimenticolaceae bacterium]|nr:MOSC N-terminal beta barrel domain-containing protein [Candidatus Polarisedimenticolaceae bacterium]
MHVAELWRYPVKSLAGERLSEVEVTPHGFVGDRLVQVWDGHRIVTSRTKPKLLSLRAVWDADCEEPRIDGVPWHTAEALASVRRAAGPGARLALLEDVEARFDVLPLLVATDGAIAALGEDGRRLRPNVVVGGVEGLAERTWPGRRLRLGEVMVEVAKLRDRCVMTTYHPDTQVQDPTVLRRIVQEFGGKVALDCAVLRPGTLRLGDPVEVLG